MQSYQYLLYNMYLYLHFCTVVKFYLVSLLNNSFGMNYIGK